MQSLSEQPSSAPAEQTNRDDLIASHLDRLYAYFFRRVGHHDAEDLTYGTISHVLRKWTCYDPSRPFWPWLVTVAKRHLATLARSGKLIVCQPLDEHMEAASATRDATPTVDAAIRCENHARVRAEIGRLPPRQREAVILYYFEHLSTQEIADVEQVPVGTVYRWLSETRDHLAAALGDLSPHN